MYFIDQLLEENTQVEDFFFSTKLRPFKQIIQISQNISHREFCYRFVKYTSRSRTTNDSWGLLTSSLRIQPNQTKIIAGESIHPDDILSSPRRIVEINFFERFNFFYFFFVVLRLKWIMCHKQLIASSAYSHNFIRFCLAIKRTISSAIKSQ